MGTTIAFRNFKVNSGTISCPSVAPQAAVNAQAVLTAVTLDPSLEPTDTNSTKYALGGDGYSLIDDAKAAKLAPSVPPDCASDPLGCNHYVRATDIPHEDIAHGYWFHDCEIGLTCPLTFAPGIDCSGLVLWSYNTAAGATTKYKDANPIQYRNASGQ